MNGAEQANLESTLGAQRTSLKAIEDLIVEQGQVLRALKDMLLERLDAIQFNTGKAVDLRAEVSGAQSRIAELQQKVPQHHKELHTKCDNLNQKVNINGRAVKESVEETKRELANYLDKQLTDIECLVGESLEGFEQCTFQYGNALRKEFKEELKAQNESINYLKTRTRNLEKENSDLKYKTETMEQQTKAALDAADSRINAWMAAEKERTRPSSDSASLSEGCQLSFWNSGDDTYRGEVSRLSQLLEGIAKELESISMRLTIVEADSVRKGLAPNHEWAPPEITVSGRGTGKE